MHYVLSYSCVPENSGTSIRGVRVSAGTSIRGTTVNLSLVALTGCMYLPGELNMTIYWYLYNLRPYTLTILVKTSTNIST